MNYSCAKCGQSFTATGEITDYQAASSALLGALQGHEAGCSGRAQPAEAPARGEAGSEDTEKPSPRSRK